MVGSAVSSPDASGGGCSDPRACCHCKNDPDGKYPRDAYSFMAFGCKNNAIPFFYGLFVFLIQAGFLLLMMLSKVYRKMSANEDVDNPDKEMPSVLLAHFIPANNSIIVLITQCMALFAFLFFADNSLGDFTAAIEFFPWGCTSTEKQNDGEARIWCAQFSTVCRGIQGFLACLTVVLLVMTSSDVVEIVLNFTAVNFISKMDNDAFQLAKDGRYGDSLKNKVNEIEAMPLPFCRKNQERCCKGWISPYWLALSILFVVYACLFAVIISKQEDSDDWTTPMLRVQFDQSSGLQDYSGCYIKNDKSKYKDRRATYKYYDSTHDSMTRLEYCKEVRRWVFFNDETDKTDPCKVGDNEISHSSLTNAFDISTAFEIPWVSPFNKPLNLYFIELEGSDYTYESLFCNAFAGDGKCNDELNNFDYQFDGGDCCATTCDHSDCSANEQNLTNVFGLELEPTTDAVGYPKCQDHDLATLTTILDKFKIFDTLNWAGGVDKVEWDPPRLILRCDGKQVFKISLTPEMRSGKHEAKVGRQSICALEVDAFEPAMDINVTFEGQWESTVRVDRTNTIPTAIGNLTSAPFLNLWRKNLTGTIPREIGKVNPNLTGVVLSENRLTGFVPAEITSLINMTFLALNDNELTGSIPSKIGLLTDLTILDLSNNHLSGFIPSEIGELTKLTKLDLSENNLKGFVNCSKFEDMSVNQTEACQKLNDYRPLITNAPTSSFAPTTTPPATQVGRLQIVPGELPSVSPLIVPSTLPSVSPTIVPNELPLASPTTVPIKFPSVSPTTVPIEFPSVPPTTVPIEFPLVSPTTVSIELPSVSPTTVPPLRPSASPASCEPDSIVKRLCDYNDFTNDVNLTTSCEILRNATEDIFSTVPSGNWTVFAPVAEAFERPPANVNSRGELIYFAQFHVVNEARLSSSFECKSTNRDNKNIIKMVNGKNTRTLCNRDLTPLGIKGLGNSGNLSHFLKLDIEACNGVIHIIDNILLPPRWEYVTDEEGSNSTLSLLQYLP